MPIDSKTKYEQYHVFYFSANASKYAKKIDNTYELDVQNERQRGDSNNLLSSHMDNKIREILDVDNT